MLSTTTYPLPNRRPERALTPRNAESSKDFIGVKSWPSHAVGAGFEILPTRFCADSQRYEARKSSVSLIH